MEQLLPLDGLAIEAIQPNPAQGSFSIRLTLARAGQARLEVFDVAGRVVVERELLARGAERQVVDVGDGPALPPGVYFVRLSQGSRSVASRLVMLH